MIIIGISAYYHDSAACLVKDGQIISAVQEERFTRKKHDSSFPKNSLKFCLDYSQIKLSEVDYIIFYEKQFIKFERLLETYLSNVPRGFKSFYQAIPIWVKEKLFTKQQIKKELLKISGGNENIPEIFFSEHHKSHAASAYYPSKFNDSAILCIDGVGEWDTTSVWHGKKNIITKKWSIEFPHSIGLLYSAFTYYLGFKVNSGEYKLMGLAPYGEPKYINKIYENLIDIKSDGSFKLNMEFFNYTTGLTMTAKKFDQLFDYSKREPEMKITQKHMDIARSIQLVTEEIILKLAKNIHKDLKCDNLCLAGGVALNCVANGRLKRESPFKNIWVQPAAGDAGGSIGAALLVWHEYLANPKKTNKDSDTMQGSLLGGSFSNYDIALRLDRIGAVYKKINESAIYDEIAKKIYENNVIGWFSGRMEFGPRALGNRSILGNPLSPDMQTKMNLKIKYRESFRPFAPAIKLDKVNDWFEFDGASPYMLMVAKIKKNKLNNKNVTDKLLKGLDRLKVIRSKVPAVTHVDYSARIQTVSAHTNERFYKLLDSFEEISGCPILINTSFNVRGEPIVFTPEDAYRCFMRTEMDYLIIENFILRKSEQPKEFKNEEWMEEFKLD